MQNDWKKVCGKLGKLKIFYMPFSVASHKFYRFTTIIIKTFYMEPYRYHCFSKQYYKIQSESAMAAISNNI